MKLLRLFICVFFLLPVTSLAQNKSDSLDLFSLSLSELLNVQITTASHVVDELKKQPVSVTSISREQLELSGARTLLEAIMLFVPGVFVVEDQDDVIIGFRGLAADNNSKLLLLMNGINMNTEFFWGPPSAILNSTNYDYISKVEVIRGPGSVTLGQGALLGVINIVTRDDHQLDNEHLNAEITGSYGLNNFQGTTAFAAYKTEEVRSYISVGLHDYNGQEIREEGWARDKVNEGYKGGNVANIGTRLKRSTNKNIIAGIGYRTFDLHMVYFNQTRDLYNFYRDRNQINQSIVASALEQTTKLKGGASLKFNINYATDNIGLQSVDGFTMGGTNEKRYGGKVLFKTTFFKSNNIAMGGEMKVFDMGNTNRKGVNFIRNVVDTTLIGSDYRSRFNMNNVWIFQNKINLFSLFMEDYIEINQKIALFAAIRYDNHSFWGSNFSPRVGSIYNLSDDLYFKLTYQEGFRGAVGAQYSGGFKGDGFLRTDNFDKIEEANIPVYSNDGTQLGIEQNLTQPKPEKIKSTELTVNYQISEKINLNIVSFYNRIINVIDVGVISTDPAQFELPAIGSDIPGDWNGYWFFKNTEGAINEFGLEGVATYKSNYFLIHLSHSFVKVLSSTAQQRGSMYLNNEDNFKAYPQNVTRASILTSLSEKFSSGINYLYYYSWYSPTNQKVDGNHILNLSVKYSIVPGFDFSIHSLNLLNASNLYPMTNNVNNPTLSDGTPSLESTSVWFKLKYSF